MKDLRDLKDLTIHDVHKGSVPARGTSPAGTGIGPRIYSGVGPTTDSCVGLMPYSGIGPMSDSGVGPKTYSGVEARAECKSWDRTSLTERINQLLSLVSIHPQTHQFNWTIPCYTIKLTGLWVN